MGILQIGTSGTRVRALQEALLAHGFNPGLIDASFGPGTEAAVIAFQRSEGLLADGVVGPRTAAALGLLDAPAIPSVLPGVTVQMVSHMFPGTPVRDRKSTRLNSSHITISYAVFCLKKNKNTH